MSDGFDLDPESLRYDERGLVACIAQEVGTGAVLMLAWADREAVARTLASGEAHFWSRSRGEPWHKGATSGNVLAVREIRVDCDRDALLLRVEAAGPACHRGSRSCFEPNAAALELGWLAEVIAARRGAAAESSYTARLLEAGVARIAQKVGEEAVEVVIAALQGEKSDRSDRSDESDEERFGLELDRSDESDEERFGLELDRSAESAEESSESGSESDKSDLSDKSDPLAAEAADLLYHLLVLLEARGIAPAEIARALRQRHTPGDSE